MFSMVNGDDLFNTYAQIKEAKTPRLIWIFSKIYLYIFISLFIYVVLSLFIGIIGDTYERLKVCKSSALVLLKDKLFISSSKVKVKKKCL